MKLKDFLNESATTSVNVAKMNKGDVASLQEITMAPGIDYVEEIIKFSKDILINNNFARGETVEIPLSAEEVLQSFQVSSPTLSKYKVPKIEQFDCIIIAGQYYVNTSEEISNPNWIKLDKK